MKIENGQLVKLISKDYPIPYGSEGIAVNLRGSDYMVDFGEKGSFQVYDYELRITKGRENFDDRERIKEEYESWVDEVCEECDWKTNITMDEVQEKYSEIALRYALGIIEKFLEMDPGDGLSMMENKRNEIKKMLE